jgi:hypothetical protein
MVERTDEEKIDLERKERTPDADSKLSNTKQVFLVTVLRECEIPFDYRS